MCITMEDYAAIRQKFLIDGISQRQIATELGMSRNTVAKYCKGDTYAGLRANYCRDATVMTQDVIQFVDECLLEDSLEPNKKQHHTSRRIYQRLVEEKGFTGAESSVRRLVGRRRKNLPHAFVPLDFKPGDAMQIDFGEAYAYLNEGNRTKVYLFCARLSYSCAPFVVCFRKQNTEAFLEGIVLAMEFFGGVTRRIIFDNARVAVKDGAGKMAIPQESYAALSAHYCFRMDFCNVRSGNEKGLVENLVGWARRNLLVPVPRADSLEKLNLMLRTSCETYIASHQVVGKPAPVASMLEEDRRGMLPLPGIAYDTRLTDIARVSAFATTRFQTNDYSVPVEHVGQEATVRASAENVYIYVAGKEIAKHLRQYGKHGQSLALAHYLPLLEKRPRSILQARPVRQNISRTLLHLLETTEFKARDLMDILTLCATRGEDAFWKNELEFLERPVRSPVIKDHVQVETVDLSCYDTLIQGGETVCRMQA